MSEGAAGFISEAFSIRHRGVVLYERHVSIHREVVSTIIYLTLLTQ